MDTKLLIQEFYVDEWDDMALLVKEIEELLMRIKRTRERIVVQITLEERNIIKIGGVK